jgi:hypothetical protein
MKILRIDCIIPEILNGLPHIHNWNWVSIIAWRLHTTIKGFLHNWCSKCIGQHSSSITNQYYCISIHLLCRSSATYFDPVGSSSDNHYMNMPHFIELFTYMDPDQWLINSPFVLHYNINCWILNYKMYISFKKLVCIKLKMCNCCDNFSWCNGVCHIIWL